MSHMTVADYYKDTVGQAVAEWLDDIEQIYPERRSCVPLIMEIKNRMLVQIDQFQFETGKPMPEHIFNTRFAELGRRVQVCIGTHDELPKNIDKAIEELDKKIIIGDTQFALKNEVGNWTRRFNQASTKQSSGCAPLVQEKAREMLLQLEQMKDLPASDLSRLSKRAEKYLENSAQRCLQNGVKAVPSGLPKDLQSKPSQTPPTRRPNPDTEMQD